MLDSQSNPESTQEIAAPSTMTLKEFLETDFALLTCEDTLTGEDVVEGFTCPVAQLFE